MGGRTSMRRVRIGCSGWSYKDWRLRIPDQTDVVRRELAAARRDMRS